MFRRNTDRAAKWVGAVLAAGALAGGAGVAPSAARGGVVIVGHSAAVDAQRKRASFALEFDKAPDFYTLDSVGRVADSFQYEIDPDGPASADFPVNDVDAVVRGDEIHATDALRVRGGFHDAPDPDPLAGGWGPVRTTVPFNLDGRHLTFEVPLDALGDGAADGIFSYRVFTTDFGLTTSQIEASVGAISVPLPPGAWGAALTLGAWVACAFQARVRRFIRTSLA